MGNQHVNQVCHIQFLSVIMVSYIAMINVCMLISFLCRYLHDEIIVLGQNASFDFINPNLISMVRETKFYWDKDDIKHRLETCA